jgi:hypothetical protein
MKLHRAVLAAILLTAPSALAEVTYQSVPRTMNFEVKLGPYKPLIDEEPGLTGSPYAETFSGSMLLFELEADRYLWQKVGALGIGFSAGYAEKYGDAYTLSGARTSDVKTSLKVAPLRLLGLYRFDYGAQHYGIPLVPYLKGGLVYTPWWASKGSSTIDYVNGDRAAGGKWGAEVCVGVAFLLDVLEPRLAHDFYSDIGIAHTYLFGDFTYAAVNNFGALGLDLSSKHFMFGLSFEY